MRARKRIRLRVGWSSRAADIVYGFLSTFVDIYCNVLSMINAVMSLELQFASIVALNFTYLVSLREFSGKSGNTV